MKKIILCCFFVLFGTNSALWAAPDSEQSAGAEKIKTIVQSLLPGATPDSILPAAIPGFYEVMLGAEVVYISSDGRFMLQGDLVDLETRSNLTENRRSEGRLNVISGVDESEMIIFGPEKPRHTITVFTDIDCGYCRRLHQDLPELNRLGVEIRYLFFPRAGVGSEAYRKAVSVWCADDSKQEMTWAKMGQDLPTRECENPIDEHMAIVSKLGLSGTPTLMFEDGTMIPGYLPVERLLAVLDGVASN